MLYCYVKQKKKNYDNLILIFFLCIPASAADAAAASPKGVNTLFANGLITLFISGNPVFSNGPSNLLKNPPIVSFLVIESLKI